ncbi:T9SS type A sorting domain-containing protein [Cytophagaceae bacterium ABcell3]|nr:T9SS type A sorting domain-containing protein [Cytophagaceae bacterium ABcell3]
MKFRLLLLYYIFGIITSGISQNTRTCGMGEAQPKNSNGLCSRLLNINPNYPLGFFKPNNNTTYKEVRVNLIFIQYDENDPRMFEEGNPEHQYILDEAIGRLHHRLKNILPPNDGEWENLTNGHPSLCRSPDHIPDTKIRFNVSKHYIVDPYLWNNQNNGFGLPCPSSNSYFNQLDALVSNNSSIEPGINVFFTENKDTYDSLTAYCNGTINGIDCAERPYYDDFNKSSRVSMTDHYNGYIAGQCLLEDEENTRSWQTILDDKAFNLYKALIHEIGHCFFPCINHCNDCETKVKPCNEIEGEINNHVMHNADPYYAGRTYLSGDNIAEMHRTLSITNMKNFVETCYADGILFIEEDMVLDTDIRLYEKIRVRPGAKLTIDCNITLPADCEIWVENGAELIIDSNSDINFACDQKCGISFYIHGDLRVKEKMLDISYIFNVYSTGKVILENSPGVCFYNETSLFHFNIHEGGTFHINGQDYTSQLRAFKDLNYDLNLTSSSISGNHSASNTILVNTTNGQSSGATVLTAGNEINIRPGFVARPGFSAGIQRYINNCKEIDCFSDAPQNKKAKVYNTDLKIKDVEIPQKVKADSSYSLTLYPNPSTGTINLNITGKDLNEYQIFIINSLGQNVFSINTNKRENIIDLKHLPKGVYYLYTINQNEKQGKSFILE